MSIILDSRYKCPVCENTLNKFVGPKGVTLWCGSIRCPSEAMDHGTDGGNEDEAYADLCRLANAEEEGT